jgi:hypothetical protein
VKEYNPLEVIDYYKQSKSAYKTADHFTIHSSTVYNLLKKHNIQRVAGNEFFRNRINNLNHDTLVKEYSQCKSSMQLAQKYGIGDMHVREILKQRGVIFYNKKNCKNQENLQAAIAAYKEGVPVDEIKKRYKIYPSFFKRYLEQNKIEINTRKERNLIYDNLKFQTHKNEIISDYNLYNDIEATRDKFNLNKNHLVKFLKLNNIIKRKVAAPGATFLMYQKYKDEIYKLYTETRWNMAVIARHLNIKPWHVKENLIKNWGKEIIRPKSEVIRENNMTYEHQLKAHSSMNRRKEYTLPSGRSIQLQGYEPDFLDYVFKYSILSEDDFRWDPKLKIIISVAKQASNSNYYPDFYLPKYNLVIEIKSWWTYERNIYLNKRKIRKTKEAGYKFLMIKDKKYSKFHKWLKENNLLKPIES